MGDIAESHQHPRSSRTWPSLALILLTGGALVSAFVVSAGAGGQAFLPGWRPNPVAHHRAPSASGESGVEIAVSPPAKTVIVGDRFTMDVVVNPNELPVDAVQVVMRFTPHELQVVSVIGDAFALEVEVINDLDNAAGKVIHSRECPPDEFTNVPFTLCTITFEAVGVTEGTALVFTDEDTSAYFRGTPHPVGTSGAVVVVEEPATPTAAPSATTTLTPSLTPTPSITLTPSRTPTATQTATPTASSTPYPTATVRPTSTMTSTHTPTPVATETTPDDGQRLYLPVVLRC